MDVIARSITRRLCAKCGSAIGEVHADECPVDRHAPIVEVEYVRADLYAGAVPREKIREALDTVSLLHDISDGALDYLLDALLGGSK